MPISAFLVLNSRGGVLISRAYRADVNPERIASGFKTKIISTKLGDRSPVNIVGNVTFMHIRISELYLLAVTKVNANASLVFELLHKLVKVFLDYFSNKFDEEVVRTNFSVIYELLDEVMDFGYPQNCESELLKTFITTKGLKAMQVQEMSEITKQVTGVVSWRRQGISYRKNECFIDVIESVNILMSSKGTVLNSDVSGKIMMKCFLSGMPKCKFGLNDKLTIHESKRANVGGRRHKAIEIDDVTFHQCVELGQFSQDRVISFVPADGEFELMRYRVQNAIVPPFVLLSPMIRELGKTRIEVRVTIKSKFNARLFGKNVNVIIPTPDNTAKCSIRCAAGRAKYRSSKSAIVWTIKRFPGNTEYSLSAEVQLIASTLEKKAWSKPPIQLQFEVPMFTSSGLHVRFLKIIEKSNYQAIKWVRYITQAGTYENRY